MCGIVGFVGAQSAAPILLKGLQQLEYRGYDSAGIALPIDGRIEIRKHVGELENLEKTLENLDVKSPSDGKIQSVNSAENADDKTFITIRQTGNFRIKGYVNETNRGSLYEGMEVLIRSRIDDALMKGNIKNIDLKNPASSGSSDMYGMEGDDTSKSNKYPFYIELENTDGFIIGQHVYIEPDYGQGDIGEESILLPSYYINDAKTTPWVWARDGRERLEKRTVTLGTYDSDMDAYEVKNGLEAQDFIAAPNDTLKAGMKCVEFDFTSDEYTNIDFESTNSGEELIFTDDNGNVDVIYEDPGSDSPDQVIDNGPGSGGGYTPGIMSPFIGAPVATTASDETPEATGESGN